MPAIIICGLIIFLAIKFPNTVGFMLTLFASALLGCTVGTFTWAVCVWAQLVDPVWIWSLHTLGWFNAVGVVFASCWFFSR